jgi:hypothetical protein
MLAVAIIRPIALIMEAATTFEMSVYFYQTFPAQQPRSTALFASFQGNF